MRSKVFLLLVTLGTASAALGGEQDGAQALDEAMARDPDRLAARVTDLIAGFGGSNGLTAAGIEEHIALERAGARASSMRRMLAMDLNADGALDGGELAVSQRAASAAVRGRMERQFRAVDLDGNTRIDPAELAAGARAAGLKALGEDEADMLRALLRLDRDGNDALTVDEVEAATKQMEDAT